MIPLLELIEQRGKRLPNRISDATFTKIPLQRKMRIEKKGELGSTIIYLKDCLKGKRKSTFEEILDFYLEDRNCTLTDRTYDLGKNKISGVFREHSNTIIIYSQAY